MLFRVYVSPITKKNTCRIRDERHANIVEEIVVPGAGYQLYNSELDSEVACNVNTFGIELRVAPDNKETAATLSAITRLTPVDPRFRFTAASGYYI